MTLLAINASHSTSSSTHNLAFAATELAGQGRVVDLATLDPAALLGLGSDPDVSSLLAEIAHVSVLVVVSPIYRATYSGLLKVLFDQLAPEALRGTAVVLAATAGSSSHFLSIDTGFRSLIASLGGWSVPSVVYATPSDLDDEKQPNDETRAQLAAALDEAERLTR